MATKTNVKRKFWYDLSFPYNIAQWVRVEIKMNLYFWLLKLKCGILVRLDFETCNFSMFWNLKAEIFMKHAQRMKNNIFNYLAKNSHVKLSPNTRIDLKQMNFEKVFNKNFASNSIWDWFLTYTIQTITQKSDHSLNSFQNYSKRMLHSGMQ